MQTIEPGVYRHFKTNQLYEVIDVALHTETDTPLVIYKPLYESDISLFARPYDMFTETITRDGKTMQRFEKIKE